MNNYLDNINGLCDRTKIRMRWYSVMFGEIKPVIELKIKKGGIGTKISFPLKPFNFNKNFSFKFFKKEVINKSNLPKWLIEKFKFLKVTLLNNYKRRYFLDKTRKFRITLDYDLKFFNINNLLTNNLKDQQKTIIELKYDLKDDKKADMITEHLPFILHKNSKYVNGIVSLSL